MKKSLLVTLLLASTSLFANSEWNHVTCFYRTKAGVPQLHFKQVSNKNFEFDTMGDSKVLTIAWTTKRTDYQTGLCSRLLSVGKDDTAYITYYTYKADKISNISTDCYVDGVNVETTSTTKKFIKRGDAATITIPWHIGFDTASVVEYIPTAGEVVNMKETATQKCEEYLTKI